MKRYLFVFGILVFYLIIPGCIGSSPTSEECESIVGDQIRFSTGMKELQDDSLINGWVSLRLYPYCPYGTEMGQNENYVYCKDTVMKHIKETNDSGNIINSYTRIYNITIIAVPIGTEPHGLLTTADVIEIQCVHVGDECYKYPVCG